MKGNKLKLALSALGAVSLLGVMGCEGDDGAETQAAALGVNALVQFGVEWRDETDTSPTEDGYELKIVTADGNVVPLAKNEAEDIRLTRAIACKDGKAVLRSGGFYYLFDPKSRTVKFLGNTGGGFTTLFNRKGEPVGILSIGFNGTLVAFCNGDYVVFNACALGGCVSTTSMLFNTVVLATVSTVFSVPYPSSLQAQLRLEEPANQIKEVERGDPNNRFLSLTWPRHQTPTYTFHPEVNDQNQLVAFAIVHNKTGDVVRKALSSPIDLTAGTTTPPNYISAVDGDGGKTYLVIGRIGETNSSFAYFSYDGSDLTQITTVDSGATASFNEIDMDGKGNVYYVTSDALDTIKAVDTGGNSSSATGAANLVNVAGAGVIFPLLDGVVVNDGSYKVFKPGGSLTAVPAGDATTAIQNCDAVGAATANLGSSMVTCINPANGANEVSFLPDADPNNWVIANPDNNNVNNAISSSALNWGYIENDLYVRDNTFWYRLPFGQTTATKLQNVTVADIDSFSPAPTATWIMGYNAIVDLANDDIKLFNWSYGMPIFNWDLTKIADVYPLPGSACDNEGDFNGVIGEVLGKGSYSKILLTEDPVLSAASSDASSPNVPLQDGFYCVDSVIHVW